MPVAAHEVKEILGLKRRTVELVPHATVWGQAFADEQTRLRDALAGMPCRIEHIGSTAVPGLCAKPILDIALGRTPEIDMAMIVPVIERLGYIYRGVFDPQLGLAPDHHLFIRESQPEFRTHHIHCVPLDGREWRAYLLLRDLLRRDANARARYEAEKQRLAAQFPTDRRAYSYGKGQIVQQLLEEAKACHEP